MRKRISWSLIGMLLVASFWVSDALVVAPSPKEVLAADPVTLEVYNPTGRAEVTQLFARRLDTLHGKTICELSDDMWEARRTFPVIRELLQRQFPTARIIPYTEFPVGLAVATGIDNDKIGDVVKAKGCQAVIIGNAG